MNIHDSRIPKILTKRIQIGSCWDTCDSVVDGIEAHAFGELKIVFSDHRDKWSFFFIIIVNVCSAY